jgi:hypothetical protein
VGRALRRTLDDSFDLQDRMTESVTGAVAPVLRGAETSSGIARRTIRQLGYQTAIEFRCYAASM